MVDADDRLYNNVDHIKENRPEGRGEESGGLKNIKGIRII